MANAALAKLAGSKAQFGHSYPNFGRYRFKVQAVKAKSGFKGLSAIAELKVIRAEDLASFPEGCPPKRANTVGSVISYVEKLNDDRKGGGSRFMAMLIRLLGMPDDASMHLGQLEFLTDEEKEPCAFMYVDCEVKPKWLEPDQKKGLAGKWVENLNWTYVEMTDDDLAQLESERAAAKLPSFRDTFGEFAQIPAE